MRLTTITGIAILGLSTAALAQVGGTPTEQKLTPADTPANTMSPVDEAAANAAAAGDPAKNDTVETDTPVANVEAGDPAAATDAPRK